MPNFKAVAAIGLGSLASLGLSACGSVAAVAKVDLPQGETNLSCAAVIYIANNYVEEHMELDMSLGDYTAFVTKYGTAHAKEAGIEDGNDVLGIVKMEAMKMKGMTGNRSTVLSDKGAVRRAKACAGIEGEEAG